MKGYQRKNAAPAPPILTADGGNKATAAASKLKRGTKKVRRQGGA
jgi:hypothetical protein